MTPGADTVRARTGRRPLMARLMRIVNPMMRTLLRSPLHGVLSRRMLVITFRGRRSGRTYSTPIAYFPVGSDLFVAGGAPWWRNITDGSTVGLRLRGRHVQARVERMTDAGAIAQALAMILPKNPILGRFMQLQPGDEVDPANIARAQRRGLAIARLHLAR